MPKHVAHDPVSGNTFWVEEEDNTKMSQVLTHDVTGIVSILLNRTQDGIRDGSQGTRRFPTCPFVY